MTHIDAGPSSRTSDVPWRMYPGTHINPDKHPLRNHAAAYLLPIRPALGAPVPSPLAPRASRRGRTPVATSRVSWDAPSLERTFTAIISIATLPCASSRRTMCSLAAKTTAGELPPLPSLSTPLSESAPLLLGSPLASSERTATGTKSRSPRLPLGESSSRSRQRSHARPAPSTMPPSKPPPALLSSIAMIITWAVSTICCNPSRGPLHGRNQISTAAGRAGVPSLVLVRAGTNATDTLGLVFGGSSTRPSAILRQW